MIKHLIDARLVDYVYRSLTDAQREEMTQEKAAQQGGKAR